MTAPVAFTPLVLDGNILKPFMTASLNRMFNCEDVNDRILVVVQLKGGNDGLNCVIPTNQYDTYKNYRPVIGTDLDKLLSLDNGLSTQDHVSLHPSLAGFKELYEKDSFSIVQAVGYENSNKSHFKGTDLWLAGGDSTAANYNLGSGWMGRYLDASYPGLAGEPTVEFPDPLGIQLGSKQQSLGFHTEHQHEAGINLSGQDPGGFYSLVSELGGIPPVTIPVSDFGQNLEYIIDIEQSTNKYSSRVSQVFNQGTNMGSYPADVDLANQLKTVARMISGGSKVEDASNPIGPAPLCHAFRHAVHEFGVIVQVKLIIYKLFDRYVMGGLDPLYDEVNAQLIHAGVLPQMRATAASPSRSTAAPASTSYSPNTGQPMLPNNDAPMAQFAGYSSYDPAAAQLQNEIYHTLRGLLASRRTNTTVESPDYSNSGGSSGGAAMLPSFSPTELLNALTILQDQTMVAQTHANTAADAVHQVQQIKSELLDQVSKFSGETKTHVSGADEDTIDLVGMLFEFILQDRNLPAEMQALLARLQIPFLKVAILDKHLFAQKAHPARQLLDSLALASVGWSEESDRDHRLREKIKQVVETLLKEFDDDLGVFERTHKDFNAFVDAHKKRAELAEQRAAEATRGREKLHAARRIAAREILKRLEGRQLPQIIQNVLSRPWANYLVLTLLRQGEESSEWKSALQFADEFVWSADSALSEEDKMRLTGVLPSLEKSLRHGLITVAYHENDVKQVMQELRTFYQHVLKGDLPSKHESTANSAVGSEPDASIYRAATSPVEDMVMADVEEIDALADADYSADDTFLKLAKEMTVGTWVEFTDFNAGSKERAKLSWISPISAKYLFVNRKGLKVSDKTVFALATELQQGSAVILEEVPLFDRALDAIVERLKSAHSSNAVISS